jgi:excisionase family DNA binding protein
MTDKTGIAKQFVTIAEAAEFVGLSVSTIRNLLATGELTGFRPVPGRIVLDVREIESFVRRTSGQSSTRGSAQRLAIVR